MIKNILVANHHLIKAGGTETYTFAILEELLLRGYNVEYFTFKKGKFAQIIEQKLQVKFMTRDKYDLVIANHYTCVNYLFNKGFCVQTCHGIFPRKEQPSKFADRYVAISMEIKNHLHQKGYYSNIIYNSINTKRFSVKKEVKERLSTVLSLCHSKEANLLIEEACIAQNIKLIEQNKYNKPVWHIEELINAADMVIGVGRSAYEAMACGRPVIIFDSRHYYPSCGDGYIKNMLLDSIQFNCSGRYLNKQFTAAELQAEMMKYQAADGSFYRNFAVQELNIHYNIEKYLALKPEGVVAKRNLIRLTMNWFIGKWFKIFYRLKYPVQE